MTSLGSKRWEERRRSRSTMFEILPLTPELLAELGDELGGCDFTDPSQTDFLAKTTS